MAEGSGSDGGRKVEGRQVAMVVAGILLLWFAASNWQTVRIHFWVTSTAAPLVVVIAIAAVLGGSIAWIVKRRRRDDDRGDVSSR